MWSLLALACGGLLFHERLLLLVGGNDRFTGALLAAAYPAPPAKPPFTGEVVRLGIEPGLAATLREPRLGFAIDTSQVVGGHWVVENRRGGSWARGAAHAALRFR